MNLLQILSPQEQTEYKQAAQVTNTGKYAEAISIYAELLRAHAGDAFLTKCLAESEINAGDLVKAQALLTPIAVASANDWQAAILLARTYAQQSQAAQRDAELEHIAKLYSTGIVPAQMQQFLLEKDALEGNRTLLIFHSLVPWGLYRVYEYARLLDSDGKLLQRFTLESDDGDQPAFAKDHPAEAAAGKRLFSYDGYVAGPPSTNGTATETHTTYSFTTGDPSYTDVKAQFLREAAGAVASGSSRVTSAAPAK